MKLIVLISLLSACSSYSQGYINYYGLTSEAEWHFDNGRYDEAKAIYDHAFTLVPEPNFKDILLYAHLVCMEGKTRKAFLIVQDYLRKVEQPSAGNAKYVTHARTNITLNEKQYRLIDSYGPDTNSANYRSKLKMRLSIDSMHVLDQKVRYACYGYDSTWWKTGDDSSYLNCREIWKQVDSANAATIIDWTLNGDLIHNDHLAGSSNFYHLLLHMEDRVTFIKDKLIDMIDLGNLDPYDYACVMDRAKSGSGECLDYFAYLIGAKNPGCIDYDTVLQNRKKIGLSTYYRRTSVFYYIPVYKMMKVPIMEHYAKYTEG